MLPPRPLDTKRRTARQREEGMGRGSEVGRPAGVLRVPRGGEERRGGRGRTDGAKKGDLLSPLNKL